MNKENKLRKENAKATFRSKIPFLLDPIPHVPGKKMVRHENKKHERRPLEPIYEEPAYLEDTGKQLKTVTEGDYNKTYNKNTKVNATKVSSHYVTNRPRTEYLEWNYNIFNDEKQNDKTCLLQNPHENYLGETSKSFISEHNRMKNIIISPRGRELHGMSPRGSNGKKEEKNRQRLEFNVRKEDRSEYVDNFKH